MKEDTVEPPSTIDEQQVNQYSYIVSNGEYEKTSHRLPVGIPVGSR